MKTYFLKIGLIIFGAFLLSTCTSKPKSKIRIGYLPIAECLPLYVAQEKGYFEKNGIEVEFSSQTSGPNIINKLDSGMIDIGISSVVILIKQANIGMPIKTIFGATYETRTNTNHALIGSANENIPLEKAYFGINAYNNVDELLLLNYLNSKGIKTDSTIQARIKIIPFPEMLSALHNNVIGYSDPRF